MIRCSSRKSRRVAELDVVHRALRRRELCEQRGPVPGGPEQGAARILRVARLVDQAALHQFGRLDRDEGARYAQVVANRFHGDVTLGLEVPDRDQDGVLDECSSRNCRSDTGCCDPEEVKNVPLAGVCLDAERP